MHPSIGLLSLIAITHNSQYTPMVYLGLLPVCFLSGVCATIERLNLRKKAQ